MIHWIPVSEQPIPVDGKTYLVWLERPLGRSRFSTANYRPNVKVIGNVFSFDAPAPTHWAIPPLGPDGESA